MTQVDNTVTLSVEELEVLLKTAQERARPRKPPVASTLGATLASVVSAAEAIPKRIHAKYATFRTAVALQRAIAAATYRASRQGVESAQAEDETTRFLRAALVKAQAEGSTTLAADLLAKALIQQATVTEANVVTG